MVDKETGAWLIGSVSPQFKPAMDVTMMAFPGLVQYSGTIDREGYHRLVVPSGLCDLTDFHRLYYELRIPLEDPITDAMKLRIEQFKQRQLTRLDFDADGKKDHGYYAGD